MGPTEAEGTDPPGDGGQEARSDPDGPAAPAPAPATTGWPTTPTTPGSNGPAGGAGAAVAVVAAWALAGAIVVLGVVAALAALAGARWLDGRTFLVLGLVGAAPAGAWQGFRLPPEWWDDAEGPARRRAWGAALAAAAATVLVWADLGRADLDRLAGEGHGPRLGDRLVGRDVPPTAVYAAGLAAGALAVACLAFAVLFRSSGRRRRRPTGQGSGPRRPALAGALAGLLLVPVLLVVGGDRRERADDRAQAATVEQAVTAQAARVGDQPGPALPATEAWRIDSLPFSAGSRQVVAVPGWDLLLVAGGEPRNADGDRNGLAAFSATEGAELWRYESRAGFGPVAVDPEAGRMLVVAWDAAVVLRLEDGSEVTRRRLPGGLSGCESQADDTQGSDSRVTVAPVVALRCDGEDATADTLALVEVATAEPAAEPVEPEWGAAGCGSGDYSLTPSGPPVVVRWTGDNPRCARPAVFTVRRRPGTLEPLTSIHPPDDLPPPTEDASPQLEQARAFGVGDLTVLALAWRMSAGPGDATGVAQRDLVAVGPTGAIRWRASGAPVDAYDLSGPSPDSRFLPVAATDAGVIAVWGDDWHLLSAEDGADHRQPALPGELTGAVRPATGAGHIYTFPEDAGLVVRSAADLSVLATWEGFPRGFVGEAMVAGGHLVVHDVEAETLTGFADGTPPGDHAGSGTPATYQQVDDLCAQLDLSPLDPIVGPVTGDGPEEPVGEYRDCTLERQGRATPTGQPQADDYYIDATSRMPEPATPQGEFEGAFPPPDRDAGEVVREVGGLGERAQLRTHVEDAPTQGDRPLGWHRLDATLKVQDGNLLLTVRLVGTVHAGTEPLHYQYDDHLTQIVRNTMENLE